MALTPDKKKTAGVGVGLTLFGLSLLLYGTRIFVTANQEGHLFSVMLIIIFGALLSISSLLVFVLPAAYDYLLESMQQDD